jgi:outer membrane protein
MKRTISLYAAAFAFSTFSISAFAETTLRVALVDVQNAILQTNEGKAQREKIEKEFNEKRQNLANQEKQLKKMNDDFLVQQSILSEADKQNKQKEFQMKLQQYQQDQMAFEQEARQKESTALQSIFSNLQKEIQKIAKQKNYDMVFDKSAGVLLYTVNPNDITEEVVKQYNNDYKVK